MSLELKSNEGNVIRQGTAPNVAANPRLKNCIWIKEGTVGVPPSIQLYNVVTNAWGCDSCNPYDGTVLTKLDPPIFAPVDGSKTDGFSMTHPTAGVTLWYSINGQPYQQYGGGTVLFGTTDYFYVSAYAVKAGMADSDTLLVEYVYG